MTVTHLVVGTDVGKGSKYWCGKGGGDRNTLGGLGTYDKTPN